MSVYNTLNARECIALQRPPPPLPRPLPVLSSEPGVCQNIALHAAFAAGRTPSTYVVLAFPDSFNFIFPQASPIINT